MLEQTVSSSETSSNKTSSTEAPSTEALLERLEQLRTALNRVLRGKPEVIEFALTCLLARGHLLVEDLPGLGKTTLAKALAEAMGGRFSRVQCTPDLLPSDVTGVSIFNQQSRRMEFHPGPVFADVLLADEINRATPRTQSALLEVMAERQATIDNSTHQLSSTFFVIATQNPIELHGTFPLPEAQLDRFAMKLRIGHPDREYMQQILEASIGRAHDEKPDIETVISLEELHRLQKHTARVAAKRVVVDYLMDVSQTVSENNAVRFGVSPRGLLIWLRAAQGWAVLHGRDFVTPQDVQKVALPVLEVRLGLDSDDCAEIVSQALESTPTPDQ